MSKLNVLVLAAVAMLAVSVEADDCSDQSGFTGTQPQNLGKTCAQQTPDNCKFLDESIKKCCTTCQTRKDETPAPNVKDNTPPPKKKKKKGCFHGDDRVETKEFGTITINELAKIRSNVQVLSRNDEGELEYSNVRHWLHLEPTTTMKFINLRTQSGHRLSISSEHLIYETDCRGGAGDAIYAKNVRIGKCVYIKNENGEFKETPVTEMDQQRMTGIYSPITDTGSIVVNDVLASCYSYYENEALQKFVYQIVWGFQDFLAKWLPDSVYQAACNYQHGSIVSVPQLALNFLQLNSVFVY